MSGKDMRSTLFRWTLGAGMLSTCLLEYVQVSATLRHDPHILDQFIVGQGPAPEQYRVLVPHVAYWLSAHIPGMVLYRSISLLNLIGIFFAGFLLLGLLERAAIYRKATRALQWMGTAAFVLLMGFYLQWALAFYRPDTLLDAGSLAAMYWLWALPREQVATTGRKLLVAVALLILAVLQGFMRADMGIAMDLGVFLASAAGVRGLSLPRRWTIATSLLGVLIGAGVLLYLMRIVYPQASYGQVKVIMLWQNIRHWRSVVPFLLFGLPIFWTFRQAWKRRDELGPASLAMLISSIVFMGMWLTMGKVDEVRIYTGFALVLIPTTCQLLIRTAEAAGA